MSDFEDSSSSSSSSSSDDLGYGRATFIALLLILIFHIARRFFYFPSASSPPPKRRPLPPPSTAPSSSESRVSEADLGFLIQNLDDNNANWEHVIDKSNHLLSYTAKCCKPKDEPLKYLSMTVFENCSVEKLVGFYMDNDYRKQWDKTIVQHDQLQVDETTGTEIGRTVKKFPLITPREYILAWRLWEGEDKTFYCFIKECEHPSTPRNKKYVRVGFFRSGWRIRKVPGRNACEIKMCHQEDAGLNVEMGKLAFSRGIWSYVCKMDNALRKYNTISHPRVAPTVSAASLIQKVPPGLETTYIILGASATPEVTNRIGSVSQDRKDKKLQRPSRKVLANGLLLLGGVVCLSRGHSSLGAKVAMAYILTKLRKRDGSPQQSRES
ncbi:Polyketide cyclase/dehydrase and lipid transport superfamily protein [Euphorbia peplus]|nr:Polyketide cyclase/dehydrase and lipid transport superfamily protein [Euphorbia peplus]